MKVKIEITPEDLLIHQLFVASITPSVQKTRQRGRWLTPVIMLLVGFYFFTRDGNVGGLFYFIGVSLIWALFYPRYSAWRYKNHFRKYVTEAFGSDAKKGAELTIADGQIEIIDEHSEAKIQLSEVEYVAELPNHFLIRFPMKHAFIVPNWCLENIPAFKETFEKEGVDVQDQKNWKWA